MDIECFVNGTPNTIFITDQTHYDQVINEFINIINKNSTNLVFLNTNTYLFEGPIILFNTGADKEKRNELLNHLVNYKINKMIYFDAHLFIYKDELSNFKQHLKY